jgi:hypothetical protein
MMMIINQNSGTGHTMEVCEINSALPQSAWGNGYKINTWNMKDYYWTNGETAYTNDEPFTKKHSRKYGQRDLFGLWLQP